ncbi:MAG: FlgD immunoglobulin-like domain containing protein, partial [Candidatus Cloacimonadaceae bacterium]|nr:FlgD immunoglobulin-like domain containing protein [Candidatus Cloacimonadaceae bacterium]
TDQSIHEELTDLGWTIDNIRIIGGTTVSNLDNVQVSPIISALYPNFPNPFNPDTNIRFSLAKHGNIDLSIYNLKGQKVKTLASGMMNAGNHQVVWNGMDDNGRSVSSGVYYYRLTTDHYNRTMKMVLMK